jgi:hypothetical protein
MRRTLLVLGGVLVAGTTVEPTRVGGLNLVNEQFNPRRLASEAVVVVETECLDVPCLAST